jgi:hypothetical protein
MTGARRIWLVTNGASGSNDRQSIANLKRCCIDAGFMIDRVIAFPEQPLPTPAALDRADIAAVLVFAGDGTANALVASLAGWSGAVLVLPGGTMNLLYRRLHGDRPVGEVVRLAATGAARRGRPGVIACDGGTAFAEALAGPGTSWRDVRVAMREADLVAVAAHAAQALGATLSERGITCCDPDFRHKRDYPLIRLVPSDEGIRVSGFRAETAAEFLEGGLAVLQRRFREGPHDDLGVAETVTLLGAAGRGLSVLLDGEPGECHAEAVFRLVPCGVDLLATRADGR